RAPAGGALPQEARGARSRGLPVPCAALGFPQIQLMLAQWPQLAHPTTARWPRPSGRGSAAILCWWPSAPVLGPAISAERIDCTAHRSQRLVGGWLAESGARGKMLRIRIHRGSRRRTPVLPGGGRAARRGTFVVPGSCTPLALAI